MPDTVPCPMSLADALMLRQEKEREMLDDNPALAHLGPYPPWTPPISEYDIARPNRNANGKDRQRGQIVPDINGQQPSPSMAADTSESYAQRVTTPVRNSLVASMSPPYLNGTHTIPPFEEPSNAASPHLPVHYPGAHSPPYNGEDDPQWSGPAPSDTTGELARESVPPFSPSQTAGRTIYSQSDPSE
jgi:hypothetical protein